MNLHNLEMDNKKKVDNYYYYAHISECVYSFSEIRLFTTCLKIDLKTFIENSIQILLNF